MNRSTNNLQSANGALNDALIEQIVREVVLRLSRGAGEPRAELAPGRNVTTEVRQHTFNAKLVTVDSLRDVPANTKRLLVSAQAVVTPAAIDDLKQRGVELSRGGDVQTRPAITMSHSLRGSAPPTSDRSTAKTASGLIIGRVDGAEGPGWKQAGRFGHATINGGLASVLARMAQALSVDGRGLLVTSAPAAAVYYACREGIRAIYGKSATEIIEAREQFHANLLVVDSSRSPDGALEAFVNSN